ncbi:MAG TPA: efflux RND transporter periplasmic adaptor subunit [Anaerolineales bacterium]|nr:efflux RND transporter periplasmic adaptor subunit [Anaerolineales bacterium]
MKSTLLKTLLAIPLIFILVWLGYQGYTNYLAPLPATPTPTAALDQSELRPEVVSAEGKVVPHQYVRLSFSVPGAVDEVFISQGEQVNSGQLLAILKGKEELEATITAAQLELTSAQQDLEALYEHVELVAAQAQMDLVDAQEDVKDAQRIIDALNSTASQAQIDAAEAAILLTERELERARKLLSDIPNRPATVARRAAAELAVYAAQRAYYRANSYLNAMTGSPSETDVARAEANLSLAEAQLDEMEKEYLILKEGPDPDDVQLAQARLDNAKAQLTAVQTRLQDLELRAPISGEIVSLELKVGEVVNPAQTQVVLADLSSWKVETTDLTEKDVALLSPGMKASITLNSFPEQVIQGVVEEIALFGEERRGAVTYVVTLDFDAGDLPVRWEMTAFVDFLLTQ